MTRSPLTKADCRAIEKILHDTRSASPPKMAYGNSNTERSDTRVRDRQVNGESHGCTDEDTIEAITDLPAKTTPPAPVQNLGPYLPPVQRLPDERRNMQNHRELIERLREHNRLEGERALAEGIGHNLPTDIFGNVTCDPAKMIPHYGYPAEVLQCVTHRPTEQPRNPRYQMRYSEMHPDRAAYHRMGARRASDDGVLRCSSPAVSPNFSPLKLQTKDGKRINILSSKLDTPSPKGQTELSHLKGKENSPSRRRRNAYSPEDIVKLNREVREQESSGSPDSLDKYREMDLAPIEPVMMSESAGDLIIPITPIKFKESSEPPDVALTEYCDTPSENSTTEQSIPEDSSRTDIIIPQPGQTQLVLSSQPPSIIKILGILPEVMLRTAAAVIIEQVTMVYDTVAKDFSDLKL